MKRAVYCIVLCLSFQLHAMKRKCVATKKQSPYCLANMPEEIKDLITEFLTCDDETDEQFRARMELEKDRPLVVKNHNELNKDYYSIDLTKPIILDSYCPKNKKWLCKIDDRDKADEEEQSFTCYMDEPRCFALSPHEKLCAVVGSKAYDNIPRCWKNYHSRMRYFGKSTSPRYWFKVLHIYNLTTKSKREFILKRPYDLIHVDFNKQGTQVIVYSKLFDYEAYENLSLKNEDKSTQTIQNNGNDAILKKSLLEDYLSKKGVCKKLQMTL